MTDGATQIELDEELSEQLEAVRGLMMFQNCGEIPSDQNVIERVIAFYLGEHDIVRSDDTSKSGSPASSIVGQLPESDLDLGQAPARLRPVERGEE